MKKKLSVAGNSLGVIIEKPILELLSIDKNAEFEMTTAGQRLIFEPIRTTHQKHLANSTQKIMDLHDETFRKLAPKSKA